MTWTIWPRNADLTRGPDAIAVWSELVVVERYITNGPATWILTGPSEHLSVFTPGMGSILEDDGVFVASGQVYSFARGYQPHEETGELVDTTTLGFIDDTDELWSRLCWPDPAHVLTGTPSTFSTTYDERTGDREDLMLGYIADNLGPAAPIASRRQPALVVPASLGRGGSTTFQARMDVLGEVAAALCEDGDLDVRVQHAEPGGVPQLPVAVSTVADVSDDVVFGSAQAARATGIVSTWRYTMDAPELTDAILFSAGDLELREGSRFTDEAAVTRWSRRRERLVDQGYTDDLAVIQDAGARALADGASPVGVEFDLTDGGDVIYRTTYHLGDRVGVELPGLPLEISAPRVREVVTTAQPNVPDRRTVVVGSPGATSIDPPDAALLEQTMRQVAKLERNR